jgi:hypothetical protein
MSAVLYGRPSPITDMAPMSGVAALMVFSICVGDMFLPEALMMISFLRSTTLRYPSSSTVTISPVCSQPSASIASPVLSGCPR